VEFTLADGTATQRNVSECRIQVEGRSATSPVVLGEPSDAPLLGAVTLETLGLMVNPLTRELLPMRLMLSAITHARWSPGPSPSQRPARPASPCASRDRLALRPLAPHVLHFPRRRQRHPAPVHPGDEGERHVDPRRDARRRQHVAVVDPARLAPPEHA